MKIKDILESIDSVKTKIYTAYRIFHSSPKIKKAIKQWKTYEDLPVVKVTVETSEESVREQSRYSPRGAQAPDREAHSPDQGEKPLRPFACIPGRTLQRWQQRDGDSFVPFPFLFPLWDERVDGRA